MGGSRSRRLPQPSDHRLDRRLGDAGCLGDLGNGMPARPSHLADRFIPPPPKGVECLSRGLDLGREISKVVKSGHGRKPNGCPNTGLYGLTASR